MMQDTNTRREFLATTAAGAAMLAAPALVRAQNLNSRILVAQIGAGSRGGGHLSVLRHLCEEEKYPLEIVAACDVYRPRLEKRREQFNIPSGAMDYREILAMPGVDAVFIATPDHHHGYQAMDAIAAGKDVYCEKPVTHWRQFELTKRLADAVAASDRVFLLGTQAMSDPAWRRMKELVKEGVIGQPIFGETGFFRIGDWGERGMPVDDPDARPGKDLDWIAFLGDAPKKPFSVDRFFRWRMFEDYAGGPSTDLYPHVLTQVIDIMGVGMPEVVVGVGDICRYNDELREVPDTFNLIAQYPEKASISVIGTQGNDYQAVGFRGSGQRAPVIRGWEGTLTVHPNNKEIVFTPLRVREAREPARFPIDGAEDMTAYFRHFLDCCRTRQRETWSGMELAFRTQTVLQMAMLSWKRGRAVRFNARRRRIVV
ncbi:Gfo/Idh/MocA family oxidoreductase [bacterium]|nr:Gfo/Idh/MocA family oxidoreductase [bacterium]